MSQKLLLHLVQLIFAFWFNYVKFVQRINNFITQEFPYIHKINKRKDIPYITITRAYGY
jgi:hypothetical protein